MKKIIIFGLFLASTLSFISCSKNRDDETGDVTIRFQFVVDNQALVRDQLLYQNAAGNNYMVTDLQMILSSLFLERSDNMEFSFNSLSDVHYCDFADESTLVWEIKDIPVGVYNQIGFVFGLDSTMNNSGAFKDPPISDMMWPETLGGGYHYMKLNCKWESESSDGVLLPLNFHLGDGQEIFRGNLTADTLFVNNSFPVMFNNDFEVSSEFKNEFIVTINVNNWFCSPYVIDFEQLIGIPIMQSQYVQYMAKSNGQNVFSLRKNM